MMKIEIWSDIACPWCYIGKRRFEAALAAFPERDALEVTWRSFQLDASAPAKHTQPTVDLLAAKYRMTVEKAQAMMDSMARTGAADGLEFRFERTISGNTFDAHRLIHFAATHGLRDQMVERLFAAYFSEGESIGEQDTLLRLATDVGLDAAQVTAMLAGDQHADDVRADQQRAASFGISGVPFFAIDGKYGISGAQPASVLTDALAQAWSEIQPAD
ncbi:MAG: DsbA family oxidoreductase [Gemmatimonadota bacterium]